jgi:hypothetical protein
MDLRPLSAVFGVSVNQIWLRSCAQNWRSTRSSWTRGPAFLFNPRSLAKIDQMRSCLHNRACVSLRRLQSQDTGRRTPLAAGAGFLVSGKPTQSADFERDLDDQ